jgi:hypothetical protein
MIRCPRCNNELPDGVSFCDACGAPVRGGLPPASPVYQPYTADPGVGAVPAAGGTSTVCPVCGAPVIPGEAFCDNCGSALLPMSPPGASVVPATPPAQPSYGPAPMPAAPVDYGQAPVDYGQAPAPAPGGARLVVSATHAEIPLPNRSELIVGREDPLSNSFPDVDLNPHGALELGVSRRHALIVQQNNTYFLEDLNSVNGTLVNQRRIPPRTRLPLHSGDQLMFGRLGLQFEER